MKHTDIIITIFLLFATLTLAAQSYSPCYTNNMSKGNTAFSQGKYSEARTYYVTAKQCAGGNPTEAQKKISACDAKIKAQKEAAAKQKEEAEVRGEFTVKGVRFKMIYVEGGTFTMGCTSEQGDDCENYEKPSHPVTVSDFWIGETEVTQALWKAVMGTNPSHFKGANLPVENVSWNDCQEFIIRLNSLTGKTFRLPTEAEWEFAARGGNKSKGYKFAGGNTLGDVAWCRQNSGDHYFPSEDEDLYWYAVDENHCRTHPVKTKMPNELNIYDMSGNVSEWCQDWYSWKYYSVSPSNNPTGPSPSSSQSHVIRAGSWGSVTKSSRVTVRGGSYETRPYKRYDTGFRIALSK